MEELRIQISRRDLDCLKHRADYRGVSLGDYLHERLLGSDRPLDEEELTALLTQKARAGNMRALDLLAQRLNRAKASATVAPAPSSTETADPFADLDELARRRRAPADLRRDTPSRTTIGRVPVVEIPVSDISDWDTFRNVFPAALGFPEFHGRNMDAWIDCLTYADEDDGMRSFVVLPGDVLTLQFAGATEQRRAVLSRTPRWSSARRSSTGAGLRLGSGRSSRAPSASSWRGNVAVPECSQGHSEQIDRLGSLQRVGGQDREG